MMVLMVMSMVRAVVGVAIIVLRRLMVTAVVIVVIMRITGCCKLLKYLSLEALEEGLRGLLLLLLGTQLLLRLLMVWIGIEG